LPKWDSSLLAYAPPERTRILPEKFRSTVIRKNGDVLPTVLVDGFVAATWNVDKRHGLEIEPLRRLTKAERVTFLRALLGHEKNACYFVGANKSGV
jgi:hypothetical protein